MKRAKVSSAMTITNLRLNPPQSLPVAAEPTARSRRAAIVHDLYSYRLHKHWMNNLRDSWSQS